MSPHSVLCSDYIENRRSHGRSAESRNRVERFSQNGLLGSATVATGGGQVFLLNEPKPSYDAHVCNFQETMFAAVGENNERGVSTKPADTFGNILTRNRKLPCHLRRARKVKMLCDVRDIAGDFQRKATLKQVGQGIGRNGTRTLKPIR